MCIVSKQEINSSFCSSISSRYARSDAFKSSSNLHTCRPKTLAKRSRANVDLSSFEVSPRNSECGDSIPNPELLSSLSCLQSSHPLMLSVPNKSPSPASFKVLSVVFVARVKALSFASVSLAIASCFKMYCFS